MLNLLLPFVLLVIGEPIAPPVPATLDRPVVLELFTSQGCSSCPPADRVLAELSEEEDVIALSYHVDYWNYLGWEDPFSSPYYSARQRDYTERLQSRTYTPQLVINGREELVGSRRSEVRAKVTAARARQAAYAPTITVSPVADNRLKIGYQLNGDPAGLRVSAVLTQNTAASAVRRGENRGKDLHHVNVVRDLVHSKAAASGELIVTIPEGLEIGDTRVVLLVQQPKSQAIVGAVRSTLSAR